MAPRAPLLALILAACGGGGGGGSAPPAVAPLPPPPNVVIVVADDLGYGDLGCFGSARIATPRIDGLAAEGARFTSFYAQSVCTPTRAALLTGRYSRRLGMTSALGPWSLVGLDPAEETLGEVLRAAGYRTAFFGKWHLGDSPDQLPDAQGFDEFVGLPWGPTGTPVIEVDSRAGTITYGPDPLTQTRRATDGALDFVGRVHGADPDRRFLCVVSYVAPHDPAAASDPFRGRSLDGRDYGDAVEEMDAEVGRLVDGLDALGLGEDTLVLFLSDNGAKLGGDPYDNGSNGPLRGGKGSTLEGGVRVPAVLRWPGTVAPGREVRWPLHVVDLVPSLAALARAPLPARPLDGVDLARGLAFGEAPPADRVLAFSRSGAFEAARRGPYKLHLGALYDVDADPGESVDLLANAGPALQAIAAELTAELARLEADAQADPSGPAPTTRFVRRWSPSRGPEAPVHGDAWASTLAAGSTLHMVDEDPALDLERVDAGPGLATPVSSHAYAYAAPSAALRWERPGDGLDPAGPFSLTLRHLLPPGGATGPLCLLDVGDGAAGLSLTVGDGGVLGDDPGPGRVDDLRLCVGGAAAGASSVTLTVDLPDGPRGAHLAVVREEGGTLRLFVDGEERAAAAPPGPGPDAGLGGTWAVGAPAGELGASGAPEPPFPAREAAGTFGEFVVVGRALTEPEVSLERCRHLRIESCVALPNSSGERARLDVGGSLIPADRALRWILTGAPPGSVGVLMASTGLARSPLGAGYLCLGDPVVSFDAEPVAIGPDGSASFVSQGFLDLPQAAGVVDLVHAQLYFVDRTPSGQPTVNTTNVVRLRLCAD